MDAARDYITQCLAGCPAGAEQRLLAELARHLLNRLKTYNPVILQDSQGAFGFLFPVPPTPDVEPDENNPEYIAELKRRMDSPAPQLSAEAFLALLSPSAKTVSTE